MERRCAASLAFAAACAVLAPAHASYVRRAAAPALQAEAPASQAEGAEAERWREAVQQSLSVDFWQLMPAAPEHVGMAKESKRQSNSSQAADGEKAKEQAQGQPVAMQVPQEELEKLSSGLSAHCQERFSAILRGKGPQLHDFGGPRGGEATTSGCRRLNGSLCATRANIVHMKSAPNGRKMRSTLEAQGQGCLPSECLDKSDLEVLATFMQLKAKELVPGTGVRVELHVDCTKSGGSVAAIGLDAEQHAKEASAPASTLEHEGAAGRGQEAQHSGCAGLVVNGLPVLAATLLAQLRALL